MVKIFGIGLPRTGSTSLMIALAHLKFRSLHYAANFEELGLFDATTEVPFPIADIEAAYPDCKYILTVRDFNQWIESCKKHSIRRVEGWNPFWWKTQDQWRSLYQERIDETKQIPADRLLTMDLIKGDGWAKLCPFVGRDVCQHPFPHETGRETGQPFAKAYYPLCKE